MLLSPTLVSDFTLCIFFTASLSLTEISTSSKPDPVTQELQRERNTRRELESQLQQEQERLNQQEQLTQQLIQENEKERNRRMELEREHSQKIQETEQHRREMGENLSRKQQESDRVQAELVQLHQEMEEERNVARTRARDQAQEQVAMRIELENLHLQDEHVSGHPDWILNREEIQIASKTLGEGAWATVNEGIFRGSRVAVKRMHHLILSPYNVRLFEREMAIASRCRHPNLVQFIGATKENRQAPLIVMEILETSLRSVLEERELEPEEVITISLDVARALNYLHLNKPSPIIHRDLSSANVLLWRRGNVWRGKVSDFGTANFMKECATINPGTVIYSAPEAQTTNQSPKVSFKNAYFFYI